MPFIALQIIPPIVLTTTLRTLYGVPPNVTMIIKKLTLTNTSGSDATFTLYLVPMGATAGVGNCLDITVPIAAGQTYDATEAVNQALPTGALIRALASANTAITCIGSGIEISQMIFGRTFDMEVVRAILTHPKIYPFIGDDDAPKMEEFRPREDPGIWYVLARLTPDSSEPLGMFVLVAQSRTCWDIHVNILPSTYGPVAWLVSQEIFPWIWESTTARRVVGSVPAYNKLAIHYAERAGMKRFGINEKSYLKGGVLVDQVLLGISKPE